MTKEITKARILQEMEDKFALREFAPANFLFDETVIPTYDIGQHLELWRSAHNTKTVTGTGALSFKFVPPFEKWQLRAYSVTFVSGSYTIAGIYVFRNTRLDATDFSYLDLTAAQNTSYLRTLPEIITLGPGDALYANIDGYTTTGDLRLDYDYMKEELR